MGSWTREIELQLIAAMARLDGLLSAHLAAEELSVMPLLEEGRSAARHGDKPGA